MNRIAKVIAWVVAATLTSGCGQYVQREHAFASRPISSATSLAVTISMRGTWTESDSGGDRLATSAAPFTMRIGVLGRALDPARIRLEEVSIVSAEGDTTRVARVARLMRRDRRGDELGTTFGVVPARWERLTVLGVLVVVDDSGSESRMPFETLLEPVLKETRSSRLWARLSGV